MEDELTPVREPITVEKAVEWYLNEYLVGKKRPRTIEEYQKDLRLVFSAMPAVKRVVDLQLSFVDHYVASRTGQLSPATICRRLSALTSFLAALESRDLIPRNIMVRFERPEITDRLPNYLSSDQVHILRSVCASDARVFAIVVLLLETGIRIGELVRLKVNDVDLTSPDHKVVIRAGKIKKDRVVYLSGETSRILNVYLRQRPPAPFEELFLNRFNQPFTVNATEKLLKRYFRKAGFTKLRVHDLRHTFAVHFLKQRRPLNVLQKTLGHASLATTSIYAQVTNEEVKGYFSSSLFK